LALVTRALAVEWPPLGLDLREVEALSERGSFQGEGRSDLKPSPLKLPHREEGIGPGSVGLPQLPAHGVRVRLDPALSFLRRAPGPLQQPTAA
jgi:hypothetical protein